MTSAEPGRWRTRRTPYLRGIMDAFADPLTEQITIMASTQIGKTEAMLNCLGYAIDQDPGPAMWVGAREDDIRTFSSKRVAPMIRKSPDLKRHITSNRDDITKMEIQMDRMALYFAGSNSPAALSSKPIRYLFMDEVDKYPKFSGKEADPIKLATERTRTFWNRTIVKVSTPTTKQGYIWREYQKSDRCQYHVPCPHCGHYQPLNFMNGVKWPDDERDPDVIEQERLAWYECQKCHERIDDIQKIRILRNGVWAPLGAQIDQDGRVSGDKRASHRGFWINCLYSPWLTFSEVAAEFLRSKDDVEKLMNFVNSWLAEPFQEKVAQNEPDRFALLAEPYKSCVVPAGAVLLTAGVDVQKDHLYYVIRAWGQRQESWLVRYGQIEDFETLALDLFQRNYLNESGQEMFVYLANIDTGYRADEVYEFCQAWINRARPIKGRSVNNTGIPLKASTIDRMPGSGAPISGGIRLWTLDTSFFKDKLHRMIHNAQNNTGVGFHLHENPSEDYCRQMCSEHKAIIRDRKKGAIREEWQLVEGYRANHYWDCEVYALAAAQMLHAHAPDFGQIHQAPPRAEKKEGFVRRRPGGWIRRNG